MSVENAIKMPFKSHIGWPTLFLFLIFLSLKILLFASQTPLWVVKPQIETLRQSESERRQRSSGAKALSSKMTRRGALRAVSEVSAQISKFSFFSAFRGSKIQFWSNFAGDTRSKLSFSFSEMPLISKSVQKMIVQINFWNGKKWWKIYVGRKQHKIAFWGLKSKFWDEVSLKELIKSVKKGVFERQNFHHFWRFQIVFVGLRCHQMRDDGWKKIEGVKVLLEDDAQSFLRASSEFFSAVCKFVNFPFLGIWSFQKQV